MRSLLMVAALAAALTGCAVEGNHADALCSALCECSTSLPSQQRLCIAECKENIPPSVPEECTECILTASCAEISSGGCADPC